MIQWALLGRGGASSRPPASIIYKRATTRCSNIIPYSSIRQFVKASSSKEKTSSSSSSASKRSMAFATPDNVYLQTLVSLTNTKAAIFRSQQAAFVDEKDKLLSESLPSQRKRDASQLDALHTLVNTLSSDSSSKKKKEAQSGATRILPQILSKNVDAIEPPSVVIRNLETLLATGQSDPAVAQSEELLSEWRERVEDLLSKERQRMETATLMGKIVDEWNYYTKIRANSGSPAESDQPQSSAAKTEQMATFKSLVFDPHPLDLDPETPAKLERDLQTLFEATPESRAFVKDFREAMRYLCRNKKLQFYTEYMKLSIEALIHSDLLSNDKRTILKDQVLPNNILLEEITHVVEMWGTNIDRWNWESGLGGKPSVELDVRLQLNGKYRVFMDEDLTTAIFLQHIGSWWSTKIKPELVKVMDKSIGAWKLAEGRPLEKKLAEIVYKSLSKPDDDDDFEASAKQESIERYRRTTQLKDFFLSQMADSLGVNGGNYYNEDEAKSTDENGKKPPAIIKEQILRTVMAELHLAHALAESGGSKTFTIVATDFKWFGPSLSHEVIIAIFQYFGLSSEHLALFRNFLSIPCHFAGEEATVENTKRRKRGIPMSHSLSDLFSEMILFCLDYTVNQVSNGEVFLHRCNDDVWFWGDDKEKVEHVWEEMKKFAANFGLEFNAEKSGSVTFDLSGKTLSAIVDDSSPLPQGPIKWGFLRLSSTGELIPDAELIDTHITELTRQLRSPSCTGSVLSFVEGWNRYYARFLPYHFGLPAYGLGKKHSQMIVKQLANVQSSVLRNLNDGKDTTLVNYLRHEISRRFPGVDGSDIPEAWFYWSSKLGGIGIHNPIVQLSGTMVWKNPSEFWHNDLTVECEPQMLLDIAQKKDAHLHKIAKDEWERRVWLSKKKSGGYEFEDRDGEFISLELFSSPDVRTLYHGHWAEVYKLLLTKPSNQTAVTLGPELQHGLRSVPDQADEYWKKIYTMYGPGVVRRWGGFELAQKEWMPGGLVQGVKDMRSRWEE